MPLSESGRKIPILTSRTVAQTHAIAVLRAMSRENPVVMLRGRPLVGKTTLLTQFAHAEAKERALHWLEFSSDTPLIPALTRIVHSLVPEQSNLAATASGAAADVAVGHSLDTASRSHPLLQQIADAAEKQRALLVLDGWDRVREGSAAIAFFLQTLKTSQVVFSCDAAPELDPVIAIDLGVYNYTGLTPDEARALMRLAPIPWPIDAREGLEEKLIAACEGSPFLMRCALAPAILNQREPKIEDIETDIAKAKERVISKVLATLPKEDIQHLHTASLVRFSDTVESKTLAKISNMSRLLLSETGICHGNALNPQYKDWLRSGLSSELIAHARSKILDLLRDSTEAPLNSWERDGNEIKEKIHQLLLSGAVSDAEKILAHAHAHLAAASEFQLLIEFTDLIKSQSQEGRALSADLVLSRAQVFAALGQPSKSLDELSRLLRDCPKEMLAHALVEHAYVLFLLDRQEEAEAQWNLLIQDSSSQVHPAIRIRALADLAFSLVYKNPEKAQALLDDAERFLLKNGFQEHPVTADLHFTRAELAAGVGDYFRGAHHYRMAQAEFRKLGRKRSELMSARNACLNEYNAGNAAAVLSEIETIENEASRFSIQPVVSYCRVLKSHHWELQGRFREAKSLLAGLLSASGAEAHLQSWSTQSRFFWIYIATGEFVAAETAWKQFVTQYPWAGTSAFFFDARSVMEWLKIHKLSEPSEKKQKRFERLLHVIREDKSVPELDRVEAFMRCLALNAQLDFPWNAAALFKPEFEAMTAWAQSRMHRYLCGVFEYSVGMHAFFANRIPEARRWLEQATQSSDAMEHWVWQFRAQSALMLLDLNTRKTAEAARRMLLMQSVIDRFDRTHDNGFYYLLCGTLHLHENRASEAELCFAKIPQKSIMARLAAQLGGHSPNSVKFSPLSVESQKTYDRLLQWLGMGLIQTITCTTATNRKTLRLEEVQALDLSAFDLLLDETRPSHPTLKTTGKQLSLDEKPVLHALIRFLLTHAGEKYSKEDLAAQVWHERYNPLAHDARVYTSIKRIREFLETLGIRTDLLEQQGGQYGFKAGIRYAILTPSDPSEHTLNERQRWILKFAARNGAIERSVVQKVMKISPTLAKSELNALILQGKLKRSGQGKATQYYLENKTTV